MPTSEGLWCEEGAFHIDPWRAVPRAIVTHAHSDHAVAGCGSYLTSARGVEALRLRVGAGAIIQGVRPGEILSLGGVRVSLHPAGHILGSAQVRVERVSASVRGPGGEVWVVTGDYKVSRREGDALDPTCDPFEPVRCHTLITESTFGLPIYRWRPQAEVMAEINAWWRANAQQGRTSVLHAYALGKAQRLLAGLDESIGPVGVHGAVEVMCRAYRAQGVRLPEVVRATGERVQDLKGRGIVVAPPSTNATRWLARLRGPEGLSTAMASGWMQVRGQRRRRGVDRGFVLSDHADWDGLLHAVKESGCQRVGVTHGFVEPFVRYLRECAGLEAFVVPSRYEGEGIETGSVATEGTAGEADGTEEAP